MRQDSKNFWFRQRTPLLLLYPLLLPWTLFADVETQIVERGHVGTCASVQVACRGVHVLEEG